MAKATVLQQLLGRPSQTYTTPAPKQYYSDKTAMMRIAAASAELSGPPAPAREATSLSSIQDETDDDTDVFYTPRSSIASEASMTVTATTTTPPTSDAGHALYTDQDWAKDIHWLATAVQKPKPPPKRAPVAPPVQRISRSPAPSIMMSMTTLLEENEDTHAPPVPPPKPPRSSVIMSDRPPSSHRRAKSNLSSYSYVAPPIVSGPPELPSYGTPAYTSLTVPPAPAPTQLGRSSSITQRLRASLRRDTADLSRSRLAQANMASVEVVSGLASPSSHNQPPRLGFTNYRTPPRAVPKASVLVQVWAVGLDAVDLRLLGVHTPVRAGAELTRSRTQSFGRFMGRTISRRSTSDGASITDKEPTQPAPHVGFIPGRSFVGRVLECGWEVRDEVVRRGEWVVGLLDIRKSGALAEFITVDRHRIVRVPHPHTVPSSPPSPPSPPSRSPRTHLPTPPSSVSSSSDASRRQHNFPTHANQNQDSPYPAPARPTSVSFHGTADSPPSSRPSSRQRNHPPAQKRMRAAPPVPPPPPPLDLAELALLPLAGVAALRAVRTLAGAYQGTGTGSDAARWKEAEAPLTPEGELADPFTPRPASIRSTAGAGGTGRRRALVLNGHAGTGGLVARILARRGWRVCVHAPGSLAPLSAHDGHSHRNNDNDAEEEEEEERDRAHMRRVQARARAWGVEEVVFDDGGCAADVLRPHPGGNGEEDGGRGAAVRAIERLIGDGDEFDAVVDCVGGREVWEAGERLLARAGGEAAHGHARGKRKQFTTTVGDCPARPVPTAKDNFRAGLRALKGASAPAPPKEKEGKKSRFLPKSSSSSKSSSKAKSGGGAAAHVVSYAWVSAAQDVDWEGEDVRDSLGGVVRMALEEGVRPVVEEGVRAALPFERAVEVFECAGIGIGAGVLRGGSVVVRVAG